jgi:hypothetical protein
MAVELPQHEARADAVCLIAKWEEKTPLMDIANDNCGVGAQADIVDPVRLTVAWRQTSLV